MYALIFVAILVTAFVVVEILRWTLRPEARRLRAIKKIRGR